MDLQSYIIIYLCFVNVVHVLLFLYVCLQLLWQYFLVHAFNYYPIVFFPSHISTLSIVAVFSCSDVMPCVCCPLVNGVPFTLNIVDIVKLMSTDPIKRLKFVSPFFDLEFRVTIQLNVLGFRIWEIPRILALYITVRKSCIFC